MMMGYEAGGYRIKDFVRMGLPITILMTIIFSIYTPYMFPLIPEWGEIDSRNSIRDRSEVPDGFRDTGRHRIFRR